MTPVVSVIMPVYNGAPFLQETLDLVLRQSFSDFELIIVDDSSSDGSSEILKKYASMDSRITLFAHENNLGHAETCNELIRKSRGQFIARQDQDDLPMIERLQEQVIFLQNHPEVGILGTSYYRLNSDGARTLRTPPQTHTEIRWRLLFDCVFSHSSVMLRRAIFQNGEPGYQNVPGPQDYELWTRLSKKTRLAVLSKPLLVYREPHERSMTVLYKNNMEEAVLAISSAQIREILSDQNVTDSQVRVLRRLRSPGKMMKEDLDAVPVMLSLFSGFAKLKDVDSQIVRRIRRRWMRNVLLFSAENLWQDLRAKGILRRFLKIDPFVLPESVLFDLPQKILRNAKHNYRKG